ncbi:sortase [Planotetraspora sp. GP83]|uniref:sortase n=1 Tax=Planotetraspora sp. GP83 TaxID=3156264 RepID=UPI003515DACD
MTPMDTATSAGDGEEDEAAYSAALELAEQAVQRLEETVARLAGTSGGPEHASALVLAGSASVLLGQVEVTVGSAGTTVQAKTAALRSRYDDALLRLGAVPSPGQPPSAPPYGQAQWVQIGPGQWAQVAQVGHAVPPGYALPPGYPMPPGYAVPQMYGMPPGYGVPPGYPPGYGLPPGYPPGPGMPPAAAPGQSAPAGPPPTMPVGRPGAPAAHPGAPGATAPTMTSPTMIGPATQTVYGQTMYGQTMYGMPATGATSTTGAMTGFVPPAPRAKRKTLREFVNGLPPEVRRLGGVSMTALTFMGALLLAFSLYASSIGHLTYERNQRIMIDQLNENFRVAAAIAAAPVAGDKNLAALPPRGEPIALLEIPKIGVREAVVQGTGTAELRSAVGHYRPSPMPGQVGNTVLAGHRNLYGAPFARIAELNRGDKIVATTQEGRFSYTVETTLRARTGEQDFISQATIVNRLTLLTTSDGDRPGGRLAVIARLDGQAASLKTRDPNQVKLDELGLGRDPSAWWPTLGWGAVFFGLLSGTLMLYRRWRRISTYLLTTPALLAIALIWFEALARLIPSTF